MEEELHCVIYLHYFLGGTVWTRVAIITLFIYFGNLKYFINGFIFKAVPTLEASEALTVT